jgi:integrase
MITVTPYYRADRKSVVIRLFVNGNIAKVVNTGIKVDKDQWDEDDREIIKHPNKKIFNQKIKNQVAELQRDVVKAELLGVLLTQDRVKKIAEGKAVTTDFFKFSEQYIQDAYTNKGTQNSNTTDLNRLKLYTKSLQFGDIDKMWLIKYENWLNQHYNGNTPWKSLKFVRKMLYAAGSGIVHNNPFKEGEYQLPQYVDPEKDGLYIEELDRIEKLFDQPIPVVNKIYAAKFLFMCYSGLRVSDAKKFTVDDHLKNGERIIITSTKTGITTNLKLYGRLADILVRMQELPQKSISDQKLNDWLKEIAVLADITRITLTTHVGRHTFGCLLAEMGVSEEEAMELMGVKNKSVVRVYYQLRQPQIDRASDKLNNIGKVA